MRAGNNDATQQQRNNAATQRNATQCNATQRNATQRNSSSRRTTTQLAPWKRAQKGRGRQRQQQRKPEKGGDNNNANDTLETQRKPEKGTAVAHSPARTVWRRSMTTAPDLIKIRGDSGHMLDSSPHLLSGLRWLTRLRFAITFRTTEYSAPCTFDSALATAGTSFPLCRCRRAAPSSRVSRSTAAQSSPPARWLPPPPAAVGVGCGGVESSPALCRAGCFGASTAGSSAPGAGRARPVRSRRCLGCCFGGSCITEFRINTASGTSICSFGSHTNGWVARAGQVNRRSGVLWSSPCGGEPGARGVSSEHDCEHGCVSIVRNLHVECSCKLFDHTEPQSELIRAILLEDSLQ